MAAEKAGMLPLYRTGGHGGQKILKLKWAPCVTALFGALVLASFCFDLLGRAQNKVSRLDRGVLNDFSGWDGWDRLDRIFVFGESYSTSNFDVEGQQPTYGNPFGNPLDPKQTEQGTGRPKMGPMGPTWVHYAALEYNQTFVRAYDLAQGGSTIDRELVNPVFPTASTFSDQVYKKFTPHYGPTGPQNDWRASNSLFAIFFGITDLIVSFHQLERTPVDKVLESYYTYLDQLYEMGARNFVLFAVPPMDQPYAKGKPGIDELAEDIATFNRLLHKTRDQFTKKHKGVNAWLFDTHALFSDIIERPKTFYQTSGFAYTKGPCPAYDLGIGFEDDIPLDRSFAKCGVPVNQYFWHDAIHVTYPVQEAMAKTLVEDCMGERRRRYCS